MNTANLDKTFDNIIKGPILLSIDNFTELSRTPWGGVRIKQKYKKSILDQKTKQDVQVGESWEFSCDPQFPSLVKGTDIRIADLIMARGKEILSTTYIEQASGGHCQLLVKLLDTAAPLSLQVHPDDSDPALSELECGKPEAWLILDSDPGAGVYLGFSTSLTKNELRNIINQSDESLEKYLNFIRVQPGDYFDIPAGVPHAIGPGLTLLEPQRVLFGKSGKTYRLWDWGRKYNKSGQPDPESGVERQLHLDEALSIIEPSKQVGQQFADSLRKCPKISKINDKRVYLKEYPITSFCQLVVITLEQGESIELDVKDGFTVCFLTKGKMQITSKYQVTAELIMGQSALLADYSIPVIISTKEHTEAVMMFPTTATYRVR
ncbi:MAG: type I phosphomannose isomerase catalytic subunit [Bdellovibrionota bacterium]